MSWIGKAVPLAAAWCALQSQETRGAEVARVVSGSRSPGELFDVAFSLGWTHESKSAELRREIGNERTGGRIDVVDDVVHRRSRDVLGVRLDAGVVRDLSLFVAMPIVLRDQRSLVFHRGGCATGAGPSGCVDASNSTLLRDRFLPGAGQAMYGFDAESNRSFTAPSSTVFRGPWRSGIESLVIGAGYAIFNQSRDTAAATWPASTWPTSTWPTWIVRFESRFPIGKTMAFDPARPTSNRGVSLGYTELLWSTVFARRFTRIDPYLSGWFSLPLATGGSPYKRYTLGRNAFAQPQRRLGSEVGFETDMWRSPTSESRLTFELRGRMELRLYGLAQGELWEVLSGSADCPKDPVACRRDVDRDFTKDDKVDPHPGVTRSPSYGLVGADAGVSARLGRYVRLRTLFGLTVEQARFLTDARSGDQISDVPGRRFRVEESRGWNLFVDGGMLF